MAEDEPAVDYCVLMNDHSLPRWERADAKHHCLALHPRDYNGLSSAVNLLGGFLGAADHAVTSEMAIQATDPSYGDFHQLGADPSALRRAHNMQHGDVAMRAISEMLGFSHSMIPVAPTSQGGASSQALPNTSHAI